MLKKEKLFRCPHIVVPIRKSNRRTIPPMSRIHLKWIVTAIIILILTLQVLEDLVFLTQRGYILLISHSDYGVEETKLVSPRAVSCNASGCWDYSFDYQAFKDGVNRIQSSYHDDTSHLPVCLSYHLNLMGQLNFSIANSSEIYFPFSSFDTKPGGRWKPSHCSAGEKLAIIIPFRNRTEHLSK